jgi:hypothetical protein
VLVVFLGLLSALGQRCCFGSAFGVAHFKKIKRVIILMVHGRAMSVLVLRRSLPFLLHFIARLGERLDSALSSAAEQSGSMQHTSMRSEGLPRARA